MVVISMIEARIEDRFRTPAMAALITVAVACASGVLLTLSIPFAALPLGAIWIGLIVIAGRRLPAIYMAGVAFLLMGYAFAGRGFANLGFPPIYIAEPLVFVSLVIVVSRYTSVRLTPVHWLLLAFMCLGALRTAPYIASDGVSALRDAVTWGYGIFALGVSFAIGRQNYRKVTTWYGTIAPWFVVWAPILFLVYENFQAQLPVVGGNDATIPYFQPGDVGVHLAGIAAFVLVGLYSFRTKSTRWIIVLSLLWLAGFLICASVNRGAMLAGLVAVGAAMLVRPSRLWLPLITLAGVLLAVLALVNPTINVQDRQRAVSVRQALQNATSIVGGTEDPALEPTKRWRLEWWKEIVSYTFHGPYFWTGKGFGVNLADSDGFQVMSDHSLRSPHNSHMTILARMGVPGLALWLVLSGAFVMGLLRSRILAARAGDRFRVAFITWILIYWLAMMVNSSFTLYLEAPQEGIWFWVIFGLGLAVMKDDVAPPRRGTREPVSQAQPERRVHRGRSRPAMT